MQVSFISHVGEVRKNNEDSVLCREDAGLFAVADGIGGLDNGEFASAAAIYEIEKLAEEEPEDIPSSLREAFYRANDLIHGVGSGKEKHGMGTTLTVACLKDDRIYLAHVGDSRAYLLNSRGVTLLSEDHSLPAQLLREGSISPQAAKTHPQKNVLTRSLGQNPRIEVYENQTVFESGDHLLLCSDGLYNMVEEDELFAITLTSANPESALRTMLEKSLQRGGFDNISAVLLYHD